MTHIHRVPRQNKLEIPRDKDEVNKREIHKYDGWTHDPDTMVAPLTPKPTRKVKVLVRAPPTIASCREEDATLRKWSLPQYCYARCILGSKTKVGSTGAKAPAPRINPNINETPTTPKSHTHPSHEFDGWTHDPETTVVPPTPKPTRQVKDIARGPPTIVTRREEDDTLRKWPFGQYCGASYILGSKTKVERTTVKVPTLRTNPKMVRRPPHPDHTPTHPIRKPLISLFRLLIFTVLSRLGACRPPTVLEICFRFPFHFLPLMMFFDPAIDKPWRVCRIDLIICSWWGLSPFCIPWCRISSWVL